MTTQEEILYLTDLLLESARWTRDPEEAYCNIELEIRDRLRRLNGIDTIDENGLAQGNPKTVIKPGQFVEKVEEPLSEDDFKALEAARLNEHLANRNKSKRKWAKNRVRVVIDGKPTWKLRSECHKEVMPGWNTKLHWVWDGPSGDEEPAVDKLGDELWNEHEKRE